jgi:phosphoribosylanthranilate isomerase
MAAAPARTTGGPAALDHHDGPIPDRAALAGWPGIARWIEGTRAGSPPPPLVKICGLTRPDLAAAAVAAGADMIGLVHFGPSPRHLSIETAAEVAAAARGAFLVALTVDADDATLDDLVAAARPDALQLHGRETPVRVAELAARYALPVAKAYGVRSAEDLAAVGSHAALPVLDAKPPEGADRPGGHGAPFDWGLLASLSGPYMLSGGLTPDNVADAVRIARPYAVDVSSGVETDGAKDPPRVAEFIVAARDGRDFHLTA